MPTPNTPTVAYAAGFREIYGVDVDCPERELWRAVLRLAGQDLFATDETLRKNALNFFESPDLPLIMALAGLDRDDVPRLRRRVLELIEAAQATPPGPGRLISFRGETRTLTQWSQLLGVSAPSMHHRLRRWSVERALTAPGQKRTA